MTNSSGVSMDLWEKLSNVKFLLIDDDRWVRNSLSLFFESLGCTIIAVATAEEGLEALSGETFDIIITDYRLPGMDGLEFIRMIQKSLPDTVMILISAYGNSEVKAEAEKMGIHEFIEKPITTGAIESSLHRLMDKSA